MAISHLTIRCRYGKNSTFLHAFGSRYVAAILIITAVINVAFAALSVGVNDNLNVGVNATFSCIFGGTLRQLIWSKTSSEGTSPNTDYILQKLVGLSVTYGDGIDLTHYKFNETSNELNVLSVTLEDEGRYWCEARTAGSDVAVNSTLASIIVPTAASTTHITYKGHRYDDPIEVEAGDQTFTCVTTGVKPAATFAWTPSTSKETTKSVANGEDSRLFDSSSNTTIQIMSPLSPSKVKCAASNTDDGSSDVEITVNLKLVKADMSTTTTTTPQDTSTPTFPTQEATMSPTTQTTSDLSSTEPSTTINIVTGSINESTTPTGPSERTTGSTEMTNSTYPLIPSTTANTPETTMRCTSLCDEETPATLSFGVILGIIAGCVCLVLIIIACGIAIWKYNNKTEVSPESNQSKNGKKKEVDGKVDV